MLFEVDKELKNSRRYRAAGKFPIKNVYVERPFANNNEDLVVTIEEFEEEGKK